MSPIDQPVPSVRKAFVSEIRSLSHSSYSAFFLSFSFFFLSFHLCSFALALPVCSYTILYGTILCICSFHVHTLVMCNFLAWRQLCASNLEECKTFLNANAVELSSHPIAHLEWSLDHIFNRAKGFGTLSTRQESMWRLVSTQRVFACGSNRIVS